MEETGIVRDQKKSGPVNEKFKFLGVDFDLEREEAGYQGHIYS